MKDNKERVRRLIEILESDLTNYITVLAKADYRTPALTAHKPYTLTRYEGRGELYFEDDQGVPVPVRDDAALDLFDSGLDTLIESYQQILPEVPMDIPDILSNMALRRESMDYEKARRALAKKIVGTMNRLAHQATTFKANDVLTTNMHDDENNADTYISIVIRELSDVEIRRAQELNQSPEVSDMLIIRVSEDGFALQIASSWMYRKIATLEEWGIDNLSSVVGEKFINLT